MKYLCLVLALWSFVPGCAPVNGGDQHKEQPIQNIVYIPDFVDTEAEAMSLHQKTGKPAIIVAARTNCPWCDKFKQETLNPIRQELGQEIIICYTYDIKERLFPTFWIVKNNVRSKFVGYMDKAEVYSNLN